MNFEAWVDPRVERVTVAAFRSYLLKRGWRPKPFPRPEVLVFEGPPDDEGKPIELWVPGLESAPDYRWLVGHRIGGLGRIENRYAGDILNEILAEGNSNGPVVARRDTAASEAGPA